MKRRNSITHRTFASSILSAILFVVTAGCLTVCSPQTPTPPLVQMLTPTPAPIPTLTPASTPTPTFVPTHAPSPTSTPLRPMPISVENAKQVTQLARWGKGTINQIVLSSDGRLLAVASSLGIYLYDIPSLTQARLIETDKPVRDVSFSPDGLMLASATGIVQLWRVRDGTLLRTLNNVEAYTVAFSPDGSMLAAGLQTAKLWRVSDGAHLKTIDVPMKMTSGVVFSLDGSTLVVTGNYGMSVMLWRINEGQVLEVSPKCITSEEDAALSPDGLTLAAGDACDTIKLWRASDRTLLRELQGPTGRVMAFSPDSSILATSRAGNKVQLWQVSDGKPLRALEGHIDPVRHLIFSPDGSTLISASSQEIRLWRVSDNTLLRTTERHTNDKVIGLAFSPDGSILAAGVEGGFVYLRQMPNGTLLNTLKLSQANVWSVAFLPNGSLVTGTNDQTAQLWRVSDGAVLRTIKSNAVYDYSVAFSPDGSLVAWGLDVGELIELRRLDSGELLQTLAGHTNLPGSLAFSPDGALLASASWDGTVRIWRASDG